MTTRMKLRLILVLFLALLAGFSVASAFGQEKGWGHLKGQIVLDGEIPEMKKVELTKPEDKRYCEENKIVLFDESFVVDKDSKGVLGVFVMMYHGRDADKGKEIQYHDSYKKRLDEPVIIDNNMLRFAPNGTVVMFGQKVVLRNSDSVGHNVRNPSGANSFNANVPQKSDVDISGKMKGADRLPQTIECNMHSWMKGRFLVRHTPYNVVTDKDGNFEIKNLPAGKHKFQFWQTRYLQLTDGKGKKITDRRGTIEIEIKDGETVDLGKLTTQVK